MQHRDRFPADVAGALDRVAQLSTWLRQHRERAFYGDVDFIPTREYSATESSPAYEGAAWIVTLAEDAIGRLSRRD